MTLIELQEWLGKNMTRLNDDSLSGEARREAQERAEFVSKIAKQMINNADVILRADKMRADGKAGRNINRLILGIDEGDS